MAFTTDTKQLEIKSFVVARNIGAVVVECFKLDLRYKNNSNFLDLPARNGMQVSMRMFTLH